MHSCTRLSGGSTRSSASRPAHTCPTLASWWMQLLVCAATLCELVRGFSWKWSNGNELWKLVVVRNLFAQVWQLLLFGLDLHTVGQQLVDREASVVLRQEKVENLRRRGPCSLTVMAPYAGHPRAAGHLQTCRHLQWEGLRSSALQRLLIGMQRPSNSQQQLMT